MTTGFAVRPWTRGYIYNRQTGANFARLDSDGNIFCCDADYAEKKIGTATRDGKVCDLDGQFIGVYLSDLYGAAGNNDGAAFARFQQLTQR